MNQDNNSISTPDSFDFFEGVTECTMNDSDNLKNVKLRAKNLAQENVQKKIAEHIRFFLKDRCFPLQEDETLSIANEISNITAVKYNVLDSDDDIVIRATVTAQLDDKDIMNYIIRFFQEREELKSQNEALRNENEDLKRQIINKDKVVLANQKSSEAWILVEKQDYEGAIKLYDEAIELNPNDYRAYFHRGECYRALKQYEKAIQDFNEAIELKPNDSYIYGRLGLSWQALKQYEKAIQYYSKAIELNPKIAAEHSWRGECYQALGNNAKAQSDFEKYEELVDKG